MFRFVLLNSSFEKKEDPLQVILYPTAIGTHEIAFETVGMWGA